MLVAAFPHTASPTQRSRESVTRVLRPGRRGSGARRVAVPYGTIDSPEQNCGAAPTNRCCGQARPRGGRVLPRPGRRWRDNIRRPRTSAPRPGRFVRGLLPGGAKRPRKEPIRVLGRGPRRAGHLPAGDLHVERPTTGLVFARAICVAATRCATAQGLGELDGSMVSGELPAKDAACSHVPDGRAGDVVVAGVGAAGIDQVLRAGYRSVVGDRDHEPVLRGAPALDKNHIQDGYVIRRNPFIGTGRNRAAGLLHRGGLILHFFR